MPDIRELWCELGRWGFSAAQCQPAPTGPGHYLLLRRHLCAIRTGTTWGRSAWEYYYAVAYRLGRLVARYARPVHIVEHAFRSSPDSYSEPWRVLLRPGPRQLDTLRERFESGLRSGLIVCGRSSRDNQPTTLVELFVDQNGFTFYAGVRDGAASAAEPGQYSAVLDLMHDHWSTPRQTSPN